MYICICMYYYDINVYVHSSNSIQCLLQILVGGTSTQAYAHAISSIDDLYLC